MVIHHNSQPIIHGQRTAVASRIIVDHTTGAQQCALRDQILLPHGRILPHYHEVEELITILSGSLTAQIDETTVQAAAGSTIYVSAHTVHAIHNNSGREPAHFLAYFPQPHPHTRYTDIEAILTAARQNDLATVQTLLTADSWLANSHTADAQDTLLHLAVRHNNRPLINLLLTHGADPTRINGNQQTPLELAQALGRSYLFEAVVSCKLQ